MTKAVSNQGAANPFLDPTIEQEDAGSDQAFAADATLTVGRDASLTLGTESLIVLGKDDMLPAAELVGTRADWLRQTRISRKMGRRHVARGAGLVRL